jgi:multidrug efflux pump subunit AcrA (membrane-fusion protein)
LAALRFSPSTASAYTVAAGSMIEQGRPATVWRRSPTGGLEPVRIGVGVDDGRHVEILAGALADGDEVVVSEIEDSPPTRLFGIRFGF